MKRKLISCVLCVIMVTAMLSGCSKSKKTSSGGVQEITWSYWDDVNSTTDNMSKGYAQVLERFNEKYKGKYHVTPIASTIDEYSAKVNALIASNECPDVFMSNPGPQLKDFVESGIAADLTDILQKDNKDWYDSFIGGIFEKITYDGKIMAIPTNFAAACVFYNTEMFEKAGAKVPTTYDEFIQTCQKLKDAGFTPISMSAGTAWCLSMLAGYLCDREGGPDNLEKVNAGTGSWLDPSFIHAGEKLVEISKFFQDTAAGDTNEQATENFYNGNAAMLIQGSWAIAQINGGNPDFQPKCGVFQFPKIEGGADPNRMIVKTDNLCLSSKTKHKEAALALMKMFTDEEAQKYTGEVAGKIPVINCTIDYDKAPKQLKFVQDILKNMTGTLGFYNESLASVEAGDTFDNAMVSLYLGDYTPEQAFQAVEDFYKTEIWK